MVKTLTTTLLPIDLAGLATLAWLVLGLLTPRRWIIGVLFPAGALVALLLAAAGMWGLQTDPQTIVLPLGLPDLPFHLRLDALPAFFLVLLGSVSFGISLYCAGYFHDDSRTSLSLFTLQYFVFLVGMTWVLLADDAYFFMVAWETMALTPYFLATTKHENTQTRHAGFYYLLIAHVGAIAILLAFGVLQGGHGDYTFATMRAAHPSEFWASITFLLALFGFGAKAGLLPLHVWLPEAHPAATSPVSAIMSGIMLKTAIYGMLRVLFDLLHLQLWWWGALMLVLGLLTALFGVLFALVQTDMKRLLALSAALAAYAMVKFFGVIFLGHPRESLPRPVHGASTWEKYGRQYLCSYRTLSAWAGSKVGATKCW